MKVIIDIVFYIVLGAALSWYFFYWRKRDLLGGYVGGLIVGLLGAILGGFVLKQIIDPAIEIMQKGFYITNVNVLDSLLGGFLALYIYNKINHDRSRSDY